MSPPAPSLPVPTRAAWEAAVRETAGHPGLRNRLARPASDLLLRFGETYARLAALPRAQRRRLQRRLGVGLTGVALLLALGLAPTSALAGTITVNGTICTLADAITTANTGTDTGGCTGGSASADTIDLQTDVGLTAALPDVSSEILLEGHDHTIQRTNGAFRVLNVTNTGDLTLKQATVSGGYGNPGGGIYNAGTLTMQNSTISGNSTGGAGGGIFNSSSGTLTVQNSTLSGNSANNSGGGIGNAGTLTVQNSTLSGNSVGFFGGGIFNNGILTVQNSTISGNSASTGGGMHLHYGSLIMKGSTLSGNSAGNGGGIYSFHSTVMVQNSTISGNSANNGGGIGNVDYAFLMVQNSTLSGNSASNGGGILNSAGNVMVRNSIVALQTSGDDCSKGATATITSQGYNIESGTSCGFTGTGDQQNVSNTALKLYTLTDNGGPTQTHGLAAGSVAIDQIPAASCLGLTTDQRGLTRPVAYNGGDANCDVGAFELQSGGNPPNAITLRGLAATGASRSGGLAALAAALALGRGALAHWRRGPGIGARGLGAGAGNATMPVPVRGSVLPRTPSGPPHAYAPPAVSYEAPLEARAGSPLSLPDAIDDLTG